MAGGESTTCPGAVTIATSAKVPTPDHHVSNTDPSDDADKYVGISRIIKNVKEAFQFSAYIINVIILGKIFVKGNTQKFNIWGPFDFMI